MTKPTKLHVRPAKTHISLGIRPVWSESLPCAQWVANDPSFLRTDSEDPDQTGRMPRLIWVFAGRTLILLVLSCRGSILIWASSWDYGTSHTRPAIKYGNGKRVRPKLGHLAMLDGCACAFEEWVYGGWKCHNLMSWLICLPYYMSHVMRKPVLPYANNKGADRLAHPRSLISAFVIRCLDSTSRLLKEAKFGRLPLLEATLSSLSSARCAPFWGKISGITGQF